jgi:predicted ATP-binding protein involved in virulence
MWISRIKLENIRCFDNIEIKFEEDAKKHKKFTLILGENGSGKSTILKAIAITIAGQRCLPLLVPDGRQWVKTDHQEGFIEADINASHDDPGSNSIISVKLRFSKIDRNVYWENKNGDWNFPYEEGWLAAGYGPFRAPPSLSERKEFFSSYDDPRMSRLINLFQPLSRLISLDSWLKELEYEKLKNGTSYFDIFKNTIRKLSPSDFPLEFYEINKEGLALFTTPYGETNLDGLSDGYRSMLIWVSDLFKAMKLAFPHSTDPLTCSGILLIDELDVHLHPRWQREIVLPLMKFFPNLQIITTTHSPLVLQGITEGKVIRCTRVDNRVVIDQDLPSVEGWRADELLEDRFFGVSVYDHNTQSQLQEQSELVKKSKLSKDERRRLKGLTEQLRSKEVIEAFDEDLEDVVQGLRKRIEKKEKYGHNLKANNSSKVS